MIWNKIILYNNFIMFNVLETSEQPLYIKISKNIGQFTRDIPIKSFEQK